MSWLQAFVGPALWAEVVDDELHVSNGQIERSIALHRQTDGRLEVASRQSVIDTLRELAPCAPWQSRGTLWCAVSARGVSLRRFSIPKTQPESLRRVLSLQVEARFPLPPDALAWGAIRPIGTPSSTGDGLEEVSVAALRSEALAELSAAFIQAGFEPVFTLASLVRTPEFPAAPSRAVALHFGETSSEWISWEGALPGITRSVPCGERAVLASLATAWNTDTTEAARRLRDAGSAFDPALHQAFAPFHASLQSLPVADANSPESWMLTGSELLVFAAARLLPQLRPGATVVPSAVAANPTGNAAIRGLRDLTANPVGGVIPRPVPVRLQLPNTKPSVSLGGLPAIPWPWVARAGALVLALLLFPYAEAVLGRPLIQHRLAALQKDRTRLSEIDRRLDFVDYLAGNQPPYIRRSTSSAMRRRRVQNWIRSP